MVNFRSNESGKVLVSLLVVINLILVAVIVWLLGRPTLADLQPVGGSTDYLIAVDNEGKSTIYSAAGEPWETCKSGQCSSVARDLSCSIAGLSGFVLAHLVEQGPDTAPRASFLDSLIPSAFAGTKDGKCPVVGIQWFNGVPILQYPSPTNDPDCPPN